jgi:hypothetical protein
VILGNRFLMPTGHHGIEITPETIGHLLKEGGLSVPLSQRSYRWESEHVQELFKDISNSMQDDRSKEYFIGSIVGIVSDGKTLIYDGQQRLSTSMILVAAIRDWFSWNGDKKTANLIQEESLISTDRQTHEDTAHLKLNAEDHAFFHNYVLLSPDEAARKAEPVSGRDSHKRIVNAVKLAKEYIKVNTASLSPQQATNRLHELLNFVRDSLRVIWVQVQDERTAFTIFETMNDRGLRLSAADLLKNRLYGIGEKRKEEVIQKWQSMTATIETIEGEAENIVEFIRCYWITGHGRTRTKDLYDEIKAQATNSNKAVALASELESASQDYAAILLSSHERLSEYQASARNHIATLRLLGVTQVRPLLLAAFRQFSKKEFEKLSRACVSWSVRTLVSGISGGILEDHYSPTAHQITLGRIKTTAAVSAILAKIVPDNPKFETAFASANVGKSAVARYYLRALQQQADNRKEPQYIPNPSEDITLEHILPSRPDKGWEHFEPDQQKAYSNRIGNQVLLQSTKNSSIGNRPYSDKKATLRGDDYSLTSETGDHATWGIEQIVERQKRLAKLAVKTWPL